MKALISIAVVAGVGAAASAQDTLYGNDVAGNLFTINLSTGAGTGVGTLPGGPFGNPSLPGYNEIEYDNTNGRAWAQQRDGNFAHQEFNIANAAGIGAPIINNASFHGMEEVGGVMYAAGFAGIIGGSGLTTLNMATGVPTLIGTGFTTSSPMVGLAYDAINGIMYGMTSFSQGAGSELHTINLVTGLNTLVGNSGLAFGSLEFGPDGKLYAGGTGNDNSTGVALPRPENGSLYEINPATGAATLVGATGFGGVGNGISGLTLVVPAPGAASLAALAGFAAARRRRPLA